MRFQSFTPLLLIAVTLGACSSNGEITATGESTVLLPAAQHETVLLVSLEDGSVIKQSIRSNADFCFKSSVQSFTTCLTQGDPVIDSESNTIIGFEMIEDHIELIAKFD